MISQTDIDRRIDLTLDGPLPPMQVAILNSEVVGTEEFVVLCRGLKTDFQDVVHFWLKARQRREWWDIWGDGENTVALVAEFADEFIAFHWRSTA